MHGRMLTLDVLHAGNKPAASGCARRLLAEPEPRQ
jgi:hypothetical protein